MKIAILGWGSLIWQPKELKYNKETGWNKNGVYLPIEFSRISNDGRLTLVIDDKAEKVQTLYAVSLYKNLDEAVLDLAVREGSGRKSIGSYDKQKDEFSSDDFKYETEIKEWLKYTDFDAVIWTNLGENWKIKNDKKEVIKTILPEKRVEYLESLTGNKSVLAEEYIRKAPIQISTVFRKEIEEKLKWNPIILG